MPRRRPHVCCETLEQKLQGLQEKDYEIKQALSRLSKGQTALRRRRRHLEQVALHVLCQSGGRQMLAQQFLERDLGEQGGQVVTHTFVAVVATYEGMSEEEINELRLLAGLNKKTTLAGTAARFLKECHLAKWVETRNMEQNIAPLVSLVAHEARATNCLPSEPTSTKVRSQLQWLRRWRKRWSVSLGCIAAREHIPPEEGRRKASLIEKVCDGSSFSVGFWFGFPQRPNPKQGPLYGPILGSTLLLYEGTGATRRPPFLDPFHRFLKLRQRRFGTGRIFYMIAFHHMSGPSWLTWTKRASACTKSLGKVMSSSWRASRSGVRSL